MECEAKSCLTKEKKKRNKHKRKRDASIPGPQVDNCLNKDVETVHNNPALDTKQRKKRTNQKENLNASEYSIIHNDREEDPVLVANPSLKSDVDMESVQNNAELRVKKKKRKKKKHNALEDSSIDNNLEEGSLLVENPSALNRDVNVGTALNNEGLDLNASEYCIIHNDREEGPVLVANPSLKSDVDMESVQNNAELGVKKKKRRKKKHNALEDSSIHNNLEEGSLLVENPSALNRDVDVGTALNNEGLVCKKKKRNKQEKMLKASEDSNIHNELENGSSLVENPPPLEIDSSMLPPFKCLETVDYSVEVSLHEETNKRKGSTESYNAGSIAGMSLENEKNKDKKHKRKRKALDTNDIDHDFQESGCVTGQNLVNSKHIDKEVLSSASNHVKLDSTSLKEKIQIPVQDVVPVEIVLNESTTCDKDNFLNVPSECDPSCKLLEQRNVLMENIEEKKPLSNLDPVEDDADLLINNKGNLPQVLLSPPERALAFHSRKKLLILDVNGLLADIVPYASYLYKPDTTISGKKVFKRPFCEDFLQFCLEKFDVGVWSSRTKRNVDTVINFLMGNLIGKLRFCWDQTHCTHTGFQTVENRDKPLVLKELRKLWEKHEPDLPWEKGEYNESNTLLLDDSPYKALRNPAHTAIFPRSYRYNDTKDCSLGPGGDLRVYLEGLATSENVQDYVKQNPFGQRPITESNLSWGFYRKIISVDSNQHNVTESEVQSPAVTDVEQ